MFLVIVDFDAGGEGLVREALPAGVGGLVELLAVHEEPEYAGDLLTRSLVVFGGDAAVDVGEAGADAVLVALQRIEVDRVGASAKCAARILSDSASSLPWHLKNGVCSRVRIGRRDRAGASSERRVWIQSYSQ